MAEFFCKTAEHVRANPIAVKYYIFYEATNNQPIWTSYKNMCRRFGSDLMDYQEFEFWFMRFSRGDFDMDYDLSKDPKKRGLRDLPLEILEKIAKNHLTSIEKKMLGKVSKYYQAVVGLWDPGFQYIYLEINNDYSILWLDRYQIQYHPSTRTHPLYGVIDGVSVLYSDNQREEIDYSTHSEEALRDLAPILANSKLKLEKLYFQFNTSFRLMNTESIENKFKNLQQKIFTKSLQIDASASQEELSIIPYLDPDSLEEITLELQTVIYSSEQDLKNRLIPLGLLAQCQNAVNFSITINGDPGWFPVENFVNCKNIRVILTNSMENRWTTKHVHKWRKILLEPTTLLTSVRLAGQSSFKVANFRKRIAAVSEAVPHGFEQRRIPIPGTNEYWSIKYLYTRDNFLDIIFERDLK
ncbi:hypothetical protein CAEBREN_13641 [Caenorhabditis brenneri]|uniref:Mos1 transposase HTH domain-containing protein n=1 Tax=Caenorhabditis brenneri TaxID=135651 RepID=G0NN13_CAEBE|nr:hypothetical protein CAEBREN_13641 [Caenorhabditis brenneri]